MPEPAREVHCLGEVRQQSGERLGEPGKAVEPASRDGMGGSLTGRGLRAHPASTTLVQTCLVCRKGDNDEFLLLCDGCDRGCHIYCHRPKMEVVPEGDWFCAVCLAQVRLLLSLPLLTEVRFSFLIPFTTSLTNTTSYLAFRFSLERALGYLLGDLGSWALVLLWTRHFTSVASLSLLYNVGVVLLSLSPLLGFVCKFTRWLMQGSVSKPPQSHVDV